MRRRHVETRRDWRWHRVGVLTGVCLVWFGIRGSASQEVSVPEPFDFVDLREQAALERSLTGRETCHTLMGHGTYCVLDRLPAEDLLPVGSYLFVAGMVVFGDPSCAERVCARMPRESVVVDGPSALAGRVRVGSAASALKHVRLFTSPSTLKLMREPWWCEIVPLARATEEFMFGRRSGFSERGEEGWPSGYFGVLSREDWRRSQLHGPRVEEVPGGFVVTRFLFRADRRRQTTSTALEVHETVSPTGQLRRDVVDTVRLSHIRLVVPYG